MPHQETPQCGFHSVFMTETLFLVQQSKKNITTEIKYSHRTILILTPDFIKSGWCDFKFQAAQRRVLDDRCNFLIVVILQEVDIRDLDETLKVYMKTNTCQCQ